MAAPKIAGPFARLLLALGLALGLACGPSATGTPLTNNTGPSFGVINQTVEDHQGSLFVADAGYFDIWKLAAGMGYWRQMRSLKFTPDYLALEPDDQGTDYLFVGVNVAIWGQFSRDEIIEVYKVNAWLGVPQPDPVFRTSHPFETDPTYPSMNGLLIKNGAPYILDSRHKCIWRAVDKVNLVEFVSFAGTPFVPHSMAFLDPSHTRILVGGQANDPNSGTKKAQMVIVDLQDGAHPTWLPDDLFTGLPFADITSLAVDAAGAAYLTCGTNTIWRAGPPPLPAAQARLVAGASGVDGERGGNGLDARFGPDLVLSAGVAPGTVYITDRSHRKVKKMVGDPAVLSYPGNGISEAR